jgi:hypothetical protein
LEAARKIRKLDNNLSLDKFIFDKNLKKDFLIKPAEDLPTEWN